LTFSEKNTSSTAAASGACALRSPRNTAAISASRDASESRDDILITP
jgi:hypothetical protein